MLKALNCPPAEWAAPDVQQAALRPGWAGALITWTAWPFGADRQLFQTRQAESDSSVRWALSTGRRVFVVLPTEAAPPSLGAWEQWVAAICERYEKGCTLILTNEPQTGGMLTASQVAAMTRAGAEIARAKGHTHVGVGADFEAAQTLALIRELHGWRPPAGLTPVLCHHHYRDVTDYHGLPVATARVLRALRRQSWSTGELWLSEGGYRFQTVADTACQQQSFPADPRCFSYARLAAQERAQRTNTIVHYRACRLLRAVGLWANYEIRDWMWAGWASGLFRYTLTPPGEPHPLARRWAAL
jgi:hypothetical protein